MAEIGTLSAGISHEISNPLTSISGYADYLVQNQQANKLNEEKLIKAATAIKKATKRITGIINGLRYFSRDGSQDSFDIESIAKIISEIREICEASLRTKDVELKVKLDDPDLILSCREVQISQVLLNLINNASDAIAQQSNKWIELHVFAEGESLLITITDSGNGIPLELQKQIFNPFFTTKGVGKGTGLGLAIVNGIILNHGGSITINSDCPNTQFVIRLPRVVEQNIGLEKKNVS